MLPKTWRPELETILVANASSLQRLVLLTALTDDDECTGTILMPQLTPLELGYLDPYWLIPFLDALCVPELETFTLCDSSSESGPISEDDSFDVFDLLQTLIVRRLPLEHLTSLELCNVCFYPFGTMEGSMTLVQRLRPLIHQNCLVHRFFSRLTGLAHLRLVNPDSFTITALSWHTSSALIKHPVPGLITLRVSSDNDVMTELGWLTTSHSGMRSKLSPFSGLVPLRTKTPQNWNRFQDSQWSAIVGSLVVKGFVSRLGIAGKKTFETMDEVETDEFLSLISLITIP
ncbi:hypothetical protein H0H92_001201 [Tricholoma furcatifolium]|nr:hypothetical protein H0H92_001201 [Tricholoma furcatifolium]